MKENNLRELVRASRKARVRGHGQTRTVECPYCGEIFKRSILPHLRTNHPRKWEQWRKDMVEMYNEGFSTMGIARECYMLFTWSVIEKEIIKLAEESDLVLEPQLNREIKKWKDDQEIQRTTVWKFVKRGTWAVHEGRYRGNFPPQVPHNIIRRYTSKKEIVLDPFVGGGTTLIESWILGRKSIGLDVSPHAISISRKRITEMAERAPKGTLDPAFKPMICEGDARDLDFIEDGTVDLICTQPPYLNVLKYTNKNPNDLSHLKDEEKFCREFRKAGEEMFRVLKEGGKCAVQIGDARKNKRLIPLGFLVFDELLSIDFQIKDIVVKLQYADRSSAFYKNLDNMLIAHEYIFIMNKPFESLIKSKKHDT